MSLRCRTRGFGNQNSIHTLPVQNHRMLFPKNVKKYPIILQTIARVIHLLGKQGLA